MKCENCGEHVPQRFIAPFHAHIGSESVSMWVDPACALELKSKAHGTKFKRFHGEQAQQLLEDFQEWKRKKGD